VPSISVLPFVLPFVLPAKPAKPLAHRGQHAVGEIRFTARAEAPEKRGAKNPNRRGFIDRSRDRPAQKLA